VPLAKAVVAWSSGKDCAYALEEVRRTGRFDVVGLLTTLTRPYSRVSMHGVREELLARQAKALGLPVERVEIPAPCPNEVYEREMAGALARLRERQVEAVIFGDLFLQDVREYRETRMAGSGLHPVFPLWGRPTGELARSMWRDGLRATVVCVDPRKLPARLAGREFDEAFVAELPPSVDPCGENGEFHTFVHHLPSFREPIAATPGEVVARDGFVFADLIPGDWRRRARSGPRRERGGA
jgi:uncharacterized protein (TIGR00290 family)